MLVTQLEHVEFRKLRSSGETKVISFNIERCFEKGLPYHCPLAQVLWKYS